MDLAPGFVDPVADAQATFRAVLAALGSPGTRVRVPDGFAPQRPLSHAAAAVLLALADTSVGVSLPPGMEAARGWLAFHTGMRSAAPGEADFVLALARPPLASLRFGTDEEPERGATLLLDLPRFGAGRRYRLSGPGIETEAVLHAPLDGGFCGEWRAMRAAAPRGVDLVLAAGAEIIGLPRSLTIEPA